MPVARGTPPFPPRSVDVAPRRIEPADRTIRLPLVGRQACTSPYAESSHRRYRQTRSGGECGEELAWSVGIQVPPPPIDALLGAQPPTQIVPACALAPP